MWTLFTQENSLGAHFRRHHIHALNALGRLLSLRFFGKKDKRHQNDKEPH
jgi:hypothetical protein